MLIFILFFWLLKGAVLNEMLVKQGLKHRDEALKQEDLFMAEHLISEGYKVLPPAENK